MMMMTSSRRDFPSISVIIPTLNEASSVGHCIASVTSADVREIIVVDGSSSDETATVAADHGATVIGAPSGRARQMNAGALLALGDVLLFLHADCTLTPQTLPRLRRMMAAGRHRVGYCRLRIDGRHLGYRLIELGSNLRARWLKRPYGDQAMFFRRSTFEAIGGFPDVPIMEDLYIARAARRYGPFLTPPGAVISSAHRWEQDGLVRRTLRNWSVALGEWRGHSLFDLRRRYEQTEQTPRTYRRTPRHGS